MSQNKYLVIFRSPSGPMDEPSPDQMQKMYAAFNTWKDKYKNEILDMGSSLKPGGKVWRASGVMDGPFVEGKEIVGGYMIVGATDYAGAMRIAVEGPAGMAPGASLEIRELAQH